MQELYFFDETFYWSRSGRRATVIEAECELTQSVRPDELRAAVVSALRVHRNFRARPVIVGRQKDSAFCTYGISYAGHHDFDSFPLGSVPRKDNK